MRKHLAGLVIASMVFCIAIAVRRLASQAERFEGHGAPPSAITQDPALELGQFERYFTERGLPGTVPDGADTSKDMAIEGLQEARSRVYWDSGRFHTLRYRYSCILIRQEVYETEERARDREAALRDRRTSLPVPFHHFPSNVSMRHGAIVYLVCVPGGKVPSDAANVRADLEDVLEMARIPASAPN